MVGKFFPTVCLTGLIAVGLGACTQWSQEKRVDWMVDKLQKELRLEKEQAKHLLTLRDEMLLAKNLMAERHKPESFDQFFKMEGFEGQDAMAHFDNKINGYRNILLNLIPKIEAFYNSLDEQQKTILVKHIKDHKYPIRWKGIFRGRMNHAEG